MFAWVITRLVNTGLCANFVESLNSIIKDPVNSHRYTKPSKFIRDSKKIILKRLGADQLLY